MQSSAFGFLFPSSLSLTHQISVQKKKREREKPNPLFFVCIDLIVSNPEVLVACTWVAFSPNEAVEVV